MQRNPFAAFIVAVVAPLALYLPNAFAHDAGSANAAYVGDAGFHLVTDSKGNCVQTGRWSPDLALVDCGGPAKPKAAAPAPAPKAAPVVSTPIETLIHFDFDKSELKPSERKILDELLTSTPVDRIAAVQVNGHTDRYGTDAYNDALSMRRAQSVKSYLVSRGVPADRISTDGYGETKRLTDGSTAALRAENRRARVIVTLKAGN